VFKDAEEAEKHEHFRGKSGVRRATAATVLLVLFQ
jgi:hypothetical protein